MGRSPCCDKVGLKKGPWTPEEDQKLLAYIEEHGHGSWRALPAKAGLQRCGKSCRLRWTNYLRPDIKRGKFSLQEEQTIIQLHALLGNRWSAIATHLPKRTDNEIKNYWNTHLKKRLTKMGIDPVTHKPKNDALLSSIDGHSKTAANLSHMAQWESARLEAEARLVRESKLRSHPLHLASPTFPQSSSSSSSSALVMNKPSESSITKDWSNNGGWLKSNEGNGGGVATRISGGGDLESPTSTLSFSENNAPPIMSTSGSTLAENNNNNNAMHNMIEFVGTTTTTNSGSCDENNNGRIVKEEGEQLEWNKGYDEEDQYKDDGMENSMPVFNSSLHDEFTRVTMEATWGSHDHDHDHDHNDDLLIRTSADGDDDDDEGIAEEGFTNLLLNANSNELSLSSEGGNSKDSNNNCDIGASGCSDSYEDNKNYWNSILHLVNSSPSDMF